MCSRIRLTLRSPRIFPWTWGCNLAWQVSGWTYLRPSARKMIFLSSTAEAKIWMICSNWRHCSRALKSTCSRWESRGRVSEMNCGETREKKNKRNHRPRPGLSHSCHRTDLTHQWLPSVLRTAGWDLQYCPWGPVWSTCSSPHASPWTCSGAELFSCLKPGMGRASHALFSSLHSHPSASKAHLGHLQTLSFPHAAYCFFLSFRLSNL